MKKFEVKQGTHIVLKIEDVETYCNNEQKEFLKSIIKQIKQARINNKKSVNSYYVVNLDEPYAKDVYETIINGEIAKGE